MHIFKILKVCSYDCVYALYKNINITLIWTVANHTFAYCLLFRCCQRCPCFYRLGCVILPRKAFLGGKWKTKVKVQTRLQTADASHVIRSGWPVPSTLSRFSLFCTAKSFHFLLASWSRVSCCRSGPQLTSYFLQHLFLFGSTDQDPEILETSHLLPSAAPFYPQSLESLHASAFLLFTALKHTAALQIQLELQWIGRQITHSVNIWGEKLLLDV